MSSLDFEDTYDGLGDQLDETDDVFNDDTFGAADSGAVGKQPVGKDFDFFGQTAKVSNAINEEQMRFSRQHPLPKAAPPTTSAYSQPAQKPARSGYEKYREPQQVPDMQVDPTLWGVTPKRHARPRSQHLPPPRKPDER